MTCFIYNLSERPTPYNKEILGKDEKILGLQKEFYPLYQQFCLDRDSAYTHSNKGELF